MPVLLDSRHVNLSDNIYRTSRWRWHCTNRSTDFIEANRWL